MWRAAAQRGDPPPVDILVHMHHDAAMRTTIDLPSDLHSVLTSVAASNRKSLSQTAVELMQRGLEVGVAGSPARGAALTRSKVTGLPLVRFARTVTPEDVKALDDEG
jgi:hypothetical protein